MRAADARVTQARRMGSRRRSTKGRTAMKKFGASQIRRLEHGRE
jgi:hypothetical protein